MPALPAVVPTSATRRPHPPSARGRARPPHATALPAFRDALRADPSLRDDYADLKRRLAGEHRDNRNAYTNARSDFVEQVLRSAGIQPLPRDLLPE
ncbi:GrpB family protein [Frankia sp. Mgl5]|nr:GrpB family protein [Frankia sp. Mgl5]MCK9928168.1 GrpB family protein [Frankia sp. Mgl5]